MLDHNQMQQNKTCFPTYHFCLQLLFVLLYNLYYKMGLGKLYSVS